MYAKTERDAVKARGVLVAAASRTRAFRVVSAREMLELGADPDAWFGLEAEPGFAFGNSPHPPLQRPAAARGAGGYFPNRAEMNAGFVAWGRGVRSGIRVPRMRQADVAPPDRSADIHRGSPGTQGPGRIGWPLRAAGTARVS